jgi:hypothetical protein
MDLLSHLGKNYAKSAAFACPTFRRHFSAMVFNYFLKLQPKHFLPFAERDFPRRKKRSITHYKSSGGDSYTRITNLIAMLLTSNLHRSFTIPGGRLYLMALSTRFIITCFNAYYHRKQKAWIQAASIPD